jgi:hypothetical protein
MPAFNVWINASSQGMQSAGEADRRPRECLRADDTATPRSMRRERTASLNHATGWYSVRSVTNGSTRDARGLSP